MADVHDKQTRSYNMSQIKGTDTKPELLVRKFLFRNGFRYKLHDKTLPGKPDIVLPKLRTIVFVHGCFWHGHDNCKYFVVPKTRTEWWRKKIERSKALDDQNLQKLRRMNWKVVSVFECELNPQVRDGTLSRIINSLKSGDTDN